MKYPGIVQNYVDLYVSRDYVKLCKNYVKMCQK